MKSIQDLIDEQLEPKEKRIRSGKFSPSSFGKCYRNQYWNRLDEPVSNPIDTRSLRVFKAGNLFHDFVQGLLINDGVKKEVLIETDDIKGFADLVMAEEVVDIKSQHSRSFWHRQKEIEASKDASVAIREMFFNNWLQVMWYAQELKKTAGRLVFISKDDLCIQEYRQELNDFWREKIHTELTTLRGYWERRELPKAEPRLYKQKDGSFKECEYCNWKDKCKEVNSGRVEEVGK